jgi:hypothetical protein
MKSEPNQLIAFLKAPDEKSVFVTDSECCLFIYFQY